MRPSTAADAMAEHAQSNDQMLQELDALSHTLYQAHASKRRTTSFAIPRPAGDTNDGVADGVRAAARPSSRRMSMSPFRSRPKLDKIEDDDEDAGDVSAPSKSQSFGAVTYTSAASTAGEMRKGGTWKSWRPIRSLSRIGMHRLGCLFSVEVSSARDLPLSMNGLRLVVAVRKKESRDGAVQTMPSRVQDGAADFEETLFVRCNLYCSGGGAKPLKFEPRPFLISVIAMEAPDLDFGRSEVDLSFLVKESADKAMQGERVREWDIAFPLAGKAKGGELVVKLAFQIMEDGGVGLYSQQQAGAGKTISSSSSSFARKQTRSSFSIASPKATRSETSIMAPTKDAPSPDLQGIDDFKLDDPCPSVAEVKQQERQKETEEVKADDFEFPEFDVIDKGVEEQEQQKDEPKEELTLKKKEEVKAKEEEEEEAWSAAGDEVVKKVVVDSAKTWRLNELESITNQINALESMMLGDVSSDAATNNPEEPREDEVAGLEADEDQVTREFLQLLEQGEDTLDASAKSPRVPPQVSSLKSGSSAADAACYISDLGKGLGPVVHTRDGGYLAAMNPFDIPVAQKEVPKLAMHLSKPFILRDQKLPGGGTEVFQRLCTGGGSEALLAKLGALVTMDDVVGKTAEQIALEGMASAIISARSNKDLVVASSSAAQSVSLLRTMAAAMSYGREDRIATGIWNAQEAPVDVDEILAFSLQKIEVMAIEALRVQADMADVKSPFEVSPDVEEPEEGEHLLDSAVPPEEWASVCADADAVTLLVVVQVRDPLRRYEAVGAPSIVIIQARRAGGAGDDEPKFKVTNVHLGGLRLQSADRRNIWDGEKQRLTAMHWLVAYGLGGKAGRKSRAARAKGGNEVLWSMSSRVMADMWLKPIRNPDVKITK